MKLFPPTNDFKLYETGFADEDLLSRRATGEALSELLEKIEDPLVVALDGAWGSGKTHFLKRWVGAHTLENSGSANVIYYDAFANDYLDDPLIGLVGEIGDRVKGKKATSQVQKLKRFAVKLTKPAIRVALATATAGATEIAGPIVDAAIESSAKEADKAADNFWKREDGRKAAMKQFQNALQELTKAPSDSPDTKKTLVIVIDELDRCRPDYALSMLEVIKHFFAVPNVHFVLGVNLIALEHSVKARYGSGFDANDYLKRFITLTIELPRVIANKDNRPAVVEYFDKMSVAMGLNKSITEEAMNQLDLLIAVRKTSLRDIERVLSSISLLPKKAEFPSFEYGWKLVIVSLLLINVFDNELFTKFENGSGSVDDIKIFYGIKPEIYEPNSEEYNHAAYLLIQLWTYILLDGKGGHDPAAARSFGVFGLSRPKRITATVLRDFFGLFEILDR